MPGVDFWAPEGDASAAQRYMTFINSARAPLRNNRRPRLLCRLGRALPSSHKQRKKHPDSVMMRLSESDAFPLSSPGVPSGPLLIPFRSPSDPLRSVPQSRADLRQRNSRVGLGLAFRSIRSKSRDLSSGAQTRILACRRTWQRLPILYGAIKRGSDR